MRRSVSTKQYRKVRQTIAEWLLFLLSMILLMLMCLAQCDFEFKKEDAQMYTDDPTADFAALDRRQNQWLEQLPRCADCYEPIQDEYAYYINGEWLCEDCMSTYKREVLPG